MNSRSDHHSFDCAHHHHRHPLEGVYLPSPPLTNSNKKKSIPLPHYHLDLPPSPPPSPPNAQHQVHHMEFHLPPETYHWPLWDPLPNLPTLLTIHNISDHLQVVPTSQPTQIFLPLLDIPDLSYHNHHNHITSKHPDHPSSTIDIDIYPPLSPISPPSPPSDLPSDDHLDPLSLILNPPTQSPSPSRRSFASLPELDIGESDPFFSSSLTLLTLPGADPDDDLIPSDLSFPNYLPERLQYHEHRPSPDLSSFTPALAIANVPSSSKGASLLLIDDPNDIPPPRSPSPENFDIDVSSIDESTDPDLKKLYELRKKALAAERAARQLEAQMLAQGAVHMRAEARRVRKKEKERCREIGALLRLKLAEGDGAAAAAAAAAIKENTTKTTTTTTTNSKRLISSLSQLVARMNFRRNETFSPLANRRSASAPREYLKSSLSLSIGGDDDDDDDYDDI